MLTITAPKLHEYLEIIDLDHAEALTYEQYQTEVQDLLTDGDVLVTKDEYAALQKCDLRSIACDQHMSENHPGGDDILDYIDRAVKAVNDGYTVYTWYGPNTEALAVGYRPTELTITEG